MNLRSLVMTVGVATIAASMLSPTGASAVDEACASRNICSSPAETCSDQLIQDACTKSGCTVDVAGSLCGTADKCVTNPGDGDGDGDVLPGGDGDGEANVNFFACDYK